MPEQMLIDRFDRRIDYLRVSVTDRCNFRCVYCMPEEGTPATPKEQQLSPQELCSALQVAGALGMRKLRFTGGEPLLRKDLEHLIAFSKSVGFLDISLTTNGFGLAERATVLKSSGLNRINISLDSLKPKRFQEIARRGDLQSVLDGIDASLQCGIDPVKVNVVAMNGINAEEAGEFARWTLAAPVHIRFIELMPIRWNLDEDQGFDAYAPHGGKGLLRLNSKQGGMLDSLEMRRRFISTANIKSLIEKELGPLESAAVATNGPARTFRVSGAPGTVGFISQISNDLCSNCNRLRLTADGFLRPCLMSDGEVDLKPALRGENPQRDTADLFSQVVGQKPERHYLAEGQQVSGRNMSQIGG